jgi:GNAT superfamily N-acetyltransferase
MWDTIDKDIQQLVKVTEISIDARKALRGLSEYLAEKDGIEHAFYAHYNKIDKIKFVVIAYTDNIPVSCGAIKHYQPGIAEIKRMYTLLEYRGKGIATRVLIELEAWAAEMNYKKCILETGKKQCNGKYNQQFSHPYIWILCFKKV